MTILLVKIFSSRYQLQRITADAILISMTTLNRSRFEQFLDDQIQVLSSCSISTAAVLT